ncbi:MAG: SUMF1/EgtB/PvdO family nonheme iron enzyme, partial [Treponema sp.]|nr:SUMF1/EgtB/PvdO family nonheme iron enzyme [Treponema sp.]
LILTGSKIPEPASIRKPKDPVSWYSFAGWYTSTSYTKLWDFNNDTVKSNMTLYAKWEAPSSNQCLVAFAANGGNPSPGFQDLKKGSKVIEPYAMSKEGHAFSGWYTDPSFTKQWDFNNDTVSSDITLFANWLTNYYTVTFDADGGNPSPLSQLVAYGAYIENPGLIKKAGYGFTGWYANSSRSTLWDFNKQVYDDIILYAGWAESEFIVDFNLKLNPDIFPGFPGTPVGESFAPARQEIPHGGKVQEPPQLSISVPGWNFYGWAYYDGTSTNEDIFKHDISIGNEVWNASHKIPELKDWDFDTIVKNDITLYARWVRDVDDMVWVQKGSFMMGAEDSGTSPVRNIKLDGFYIDKYEVTQEKYKSVIASITAGFFDGGSTNPLAPEPSQRIDSTLNLNLPVERVSWYDALVYCNRLSEMQINPLQKVYNVGANPSTIYSFTQIPNTSPAIYSISSIAGTITANWNNDGYRLPTEAEWEYAARGGNGSPQNTDYSGSSFVEEAAWYKDNSTMKSQTVGAKKANILGIYDMSGNVCEWCWDWYAPYSHAQNKNNLDNPKGPDASTVNVAEGGVKVRRGGSWDNTANNVRSVIRNYDLPGKSTFVNGIRTVRYPSEIY